MDLVGYEGTAPETVTWATAAVSDGQWLINSASGDRIAFSEAQRLATEGHLTLLRKGRQLPAGAHAAPLVVVVIATESPFSAHVLADPGRLGGVIDNWNENAFRYLLFKDNTSFEQYRDGVVDRILGNVIDVTSLDEMRKREGLLRVGLTLNASDPYLNALRVVIAPADRQGTVSRLARACMRDEQAEREFDDFVQATRHQLSHGAELSLVYGGTGTEGAIELDSATAALVAVKKAHVLMKGEVSAHYRFLRQARSPLLREISPTASAELKFVTAVPGTTIREGLSRYFELKFLQEYLRGDRSMPAGEDVGAIFAPAQNVSLKGQRPLNVEEIQEVSIPEDVEIQQERSLSFSLFGFKLGAHKDVSIIEVKAFPDVRLDLSSKDNGNRQIPEGLDSIRREEVFRYSPVVVTLIQKRDGKGQTKLFLKRIVEVGTKPVPFNALPSSVCHGAFLININLAVRRASTGKILINDWKLPAVSAETVESADEVLRSFRLEAQSFELKKAAAGSGRWLPPPKRVPRSFLSQVLEALDSLGGGAVEISDLVTKMNQLFSRATRINNTRRELDEWPALFSFDKKRGVVSITKDGTAYLKAYRKASGVAP